MSNSSQSRPIQTNVSGREYRVWLRFPSRRIASCQSADGDDDSSWSVQVHDISRTGFNLLSARKLEPGTIVKVGEAKENAGTASQISARVVQVTTAADEKWKVGCAFLKELSEEKLVAWLKEQP